MTALRAREAPVATERINVLINVLTMASQELRTVLSPILSREQSLIWITENSFVRFANKCLLDSRLEAQFGLQLLRDTKKQCSLSIHASTVEEGLICLHYLVGLKDTHFQDMALSYYGGRNRRNRLCPFGTNTLEKILRNSARRIRFNSMIFTPDHCRALASWGTKTSIAFYGCEFQDGGAAFVKSSTERQDKTSGPANLSFTYTLSFYDGYLALFLRQHKLEYLGLHNIELNSEVNCRAVATAHVRRLVLNSCKLEDEGAALVESVRQGRGPKEFGFHGNPFGSIVSFVAFMNALRGNTYLERLRLPKIDNRQETRALAIALHENKGLVHLAVRFYALDDSDRTELLEVISLHPSLRSLNLKIDHTYIRYLKKQRECTKAVADMLSVNDRVDVMSYDSNTFHKSDWDAFVAPRIDCNLYRKRFLSILKIEEASTRASVLARALAKFSSKPHLVWMLLNQNRDVVSNYLDSSHDPVSIPLRKRSPSPSLDDRSAH
jgi:hypothetical protein